MAYIGKTPVIGNFVKLDSITVVNGQAAYTMQNGGVNFTSYDNVNQFLVSLNGVLQAPTDSFTVSGSTLTFASNLSTGDVIDFVLVLGNSLDIGTPSDNTVTAAKIASDAVVTAKINDNAVTSAKLFSTFKNGTTEADQWRVTANTDNSGTNVVTANWERNDNNFSLIGTGMTESSGIFTFPSTGIYHVMFATMPSALSAARLYQGNTIQLSTNSGSSYNTLAASYGNAYAANAYGSSTSYAIMDITSTSTHRARFQFASEGNTRYEGTTTQNWVVATFIRLGDT